MSKVNAGKGRKFWEEVMQQYERSGLKIKAFCNKNNLHFSQFRNWRYRIKQNPKASKKNLSVGNEFIPLVVKDKPTINNEAVSHSIEIRLEPTGNVNICIPSQFNPEALGNLFSILRRTEC